MIPVLSALYCVSRSHWRLLVIIPSFHLSRNVEYVIIHEAVQYGTPVRQVVNSVSKPTKPNLPPTLSQSVWDSLSFSTTAPRS